MHRFAKWLARTARHTLRTNAHRHTRTWTDFNALDHTGSGAARTNGTDADTDVLATANAQARSITGGTRLYALVATHAPPQAAGTHPLASSNLHTGE